MKIFVTGVAGFLGSHLADAMLAEGHSVVGIDSLIGGERENVPASVEFHAVDCNHIAEVRKYSARCDVVYHCAATAYEGLSVFSPHLIAQNIYSASASVFSAAIANGVKRIVFCSSMARYGCIIPPFYEHKRSMPIDPYGISKLAAEDLLRNLCYTHGTEFVIAVPHNIIGPRQKYDDPYRNVAAIMINLMLQDRRPVIYGDGSQQRCFSFVSDCVSCLKKMAMQDLNGEIINIGPDEEPVSINELYRVIAKLTGCTKSPLYVPGRPQEVRVALCSSQKARKLLDYKTTVNLEDGLGLMIDFIKARGPRPFNYHLPLEIENELTPTTWTHKYF